MVKVPLVGKYGGKYALVDDCDAWVLCLRWRWSKGPNGPAYAQVSSWKGGLHNQMLHRLVLGLKPGDLEVDHIDGDGLNCQRYNLRLATRSQNCMNTRKRKRSCSSAYKGVDWNKSKGKWLARIAKDDKQMFIGWYLSELEAAKAYDRKAKELFGEFAKLNFPGSPGNSEGVKIVGKDMKLIFSS